MDKKLQALVASYARSFIVAVVTAYSIGARDTKDLVIAGLIAIAGPALRALNSKDPAFGLVADTITVELNKLAKADTKKAAPKKKTK
jgi:hypothetical protein